MQAQAWGTFQSPPKTSQTRQKKDQKCAALKELVPLELVETRARMQNKRTNLYHYACSSVPLEMKKEK
jgi:hypothetical protein